MAKRRTKKVHHRRRRMSGAASGLGVIIQKTAGLAAGAAGGFFLNQALKTAFSSLPTFVPGLALVAGGVFVDKTMGKKGPLLSGIGDGLTAAGALIALNETFISLPGISGVGFVTSESGNYKGPALLRAVGAPGFMNNQIGAIRDLANVAGGSGRMGAIFDN
jgi:hypothetical protein